MNMNDFQLLRRFCGPAGWGLAAIRSRQKTVLMKFAFFRWRQLPYQQLLLEIDGALMRFELESWLAGETRSLETLNDILQARGSAGVNIPLFVELCGGLP